MSENTLITYIVTTIKNQQTAVKVKMLDVFSFKLTEFSSSFMLLYSKNQ